MSSLKIPFQWFALVFVLGLAILVRLPNWMAIPPLTDEYKEVQWAMTMLEERRYPLVAVDSYDGPLFAYANAALLKIFGYSPELPRAFVFGMGVLTVLAAFALGKTLARGDSRVGLIAALLLAVNSYHILFNSHVAWSNCTTPFFTTLSLYAYVRGTRGTKHWWLVLAGLLFGLAVQTHPSALALAPAFAIDFLWNSKTRAQFKSFAPYLAVGAAFLAYSPVLYYNLLSPGGSLNAARQQQYAFESAPSLQTVLGNLRLTMWTVAQVGSGVMSEQLGDAAAVLATFAFWILTFGAAVWLARRGEKLPLMGIGGAIFFFATFNRFYALPDSARYFEPLLPLVFAAWGMLLIYVWERAGAAEKIYVYGARGAWALALGVVCVVPLIGLQQYYDDALAQSKTNNGMLDIVTYLQNDAGVPILLDHTLNNVRTGRGGAVASNLIYLLRLTHQKYQLVSLADDGAVDYVRNILRPYDRAYLITYADAAARIGRGITTPVVVTRFPCSGCGDPPEWGLYHWENLDERTSVPLTVAQAGNP